MKELKFRVWEEREKEYDTWSYILDESGNLFRNAYGALIGCDRKDYIIEQYTGLKDENGKEIYEGDIVEYTACYYGNEKRHRKVVEWKEWDSDDFGEPHNLGYSNLSECMEVIGNVHENAELLEKK